MNCNPDAAADGATPAAAPPSPAHPSAPMDSLPIPRCNTNCRLPGCAANPNLCPQCSAHLPADDDDSRPAAAHGLDPLTHVVSVAGGMPLDRRLSHRCDPPPAPCHEQSGEITTAEPTIGAGAAAGTVRSSCPTPEIVGGAAPGLRPSDECDGRDKAKPVSPRSFSPSDSSTSPAPAGEQKAKRCAACGKRVGPRGFKCRCGDLFCAMHRYSEKHDCSFDYKAAGRLAIAKENPLVIARKIIQL